jgi:ATP-dependent Clp protease ATP-binding subunit ClpC
MKHIFSREVKESISYGKEEALRLGNTFIGPEHLLLGLLRQGDNAAFYVLKCLPVDMGALRENLEKSVQEERGAWSEAGSSTGFRAGLPTFSGCFEHVHLTGQAEEVIRDSFDIAESFTSKEVEPEYLMLSLLKGKESKAAPILREMGVDYASFLKELV